MIQFQAVCAAIDPETGDLTADARADAKSGGDMSKMRALSSDNPFSSAPRRPNQRRGMGGGGGGGVAGAEAEQSRLPARRPYRPRAGTQN